MQTRTPRPLSRTDSPWVQARRRRLGVGQVPGRGPLVGGRHSTRHPAPLLAVGAGGGTGVRARSVEGVRFCPMMGWGRAGSRRTSWDVFRGRFPGVSWECLRWSSRRGHRHPGAAGSRAFLRGGCCPGSSPGGEGGVRACHGVLLVIRVHRQPFIWFNGYPVESGVGIADCDQ